MASGNGQFLVYYKYFVMILNLFRIVYLLQAFTYSVFTKETNKK